MKRKAFTLIELLVVMGVIGILAGLLYPVIGKMREKGRQTQCANYLKELHTACMSFTGNDGRFPYATTYKVLEGDRYWRERRGWVGPVTPMAADTAGSVGTVAMWNAPALTCVTNGTLYSYVTDNRVYLCPTFSIELKKVNSTYVPVRSYVMNSTMNYMNLYSLKDGSTRLLFTELNAAKVVEGVSVSLYAVTDSTTTIPSDPTSPANVKYYTPRNVDGMIYCASKAGLPSEGIAAYHNGKGQAVFADGHIESLYFSNTWSACQADW